MIPLDKLTGYFTVPHLTRARIILALALGVIADGLQLLLGPLGWVGVDQFIDLVAMGLTTWVLGFHLLLLPTFVVEFIPVADMLPTWTGCVVAVIALRKREQRAASVVDVSPELPPAKTPPRLTEHSRDRIDMDNSSRPGR